MLFVVSTGFFSWSHVSWFTVHLCAEAIALEKWNLGLPRGLGWRCFLHRGFAFASFCQVPGTLLVKDTSNPIAGLSFQKGTWVANLPKAIRVQSWNQNPYRTGFFLFFFLLAVASSLQPSLRYPRIMQKKVYFWFTLTLCVPLSLWIRTCPQFWPEQLLPIYQFFGF